MMRTLALIFMILSATVSAFAQEEQIVWEKNFKKALATARETAKPLMLDFTAVWCKPCKAMDEQFWVLADVVEATKPFIAVKVDFDSEKGLVEKYNVSAIPFVVFTDPLGNLITFRRGFGSKNVKELNQIFDEMPKDFSALKKYYEAVELKKDDGLALVQIADSYRKSKMLILSNDFYKKALKTKEIQTDAVNKERIAAAIGMNYYALRDYVQATVSMEDYLKDFPEGKNRETLISMLSIGYANRAKQKEANKFLELLKTEFPASKNIPVVAKALEDAKNKPVK